MTLTTIPSIRSSSSTRTTSFDVGLDWRYRGRSRDVHRVIGSRSKRLEEEWPLADLSRDESKRLRAALAEEEFEAEKRRILGS
jgi:hypothetical protein